MANAATTAKQRTPKKVEAARKPSRQPRKGSRRAEIHPLDRAIAEIRNELARSPDDALLYGRLGALQYRRGDLNEAEESYRRAIQLQPQRATFQNNLGNVLCDLGRMREGIACYEAALTIEKSADPSDGRSPEADVNLELARLEYRLVHERIEYLERAVNLDLESADALNALGGGYLLCQNRNKALQAYRKAARLNPRNAYAARNIAFTHTLDLTGPSNLTAALAEIAEGAARFPKDAQLFLHEGELFESAGLLDTAEKKFVRAVVADPRNLEAYDLLGRLREVSGVLGSRDDTARAVEKAIQDLKGGNQKGKTDSETPSSLLDQAIGLLAESRFNRVPLENPILLKTMLEKIMEKTDLTKLMEREAAVGAAVLLARQLETENHRDQASKLLDKMTERASHSPRLWIEKGGFAYRNGEIAVAVQSFERATLLDPQDAYAYQSLRFAFEGYRRYRTERVRFEVAAREQTLDALAHHHMGLASLSVLKDEEALYHFEKALDLDPRLAEAACGCARILKRKGLWTDSEEKYRLALSIDPDCQEARLALHNMSGLGASEIFLQD